jgi:uncharacterized protein YciI
MKFFLINIEYKTDIENISRITEQHRDHLKKGYDKGMFLISGPQVPRTGGVVIAKGKSKDDLLEFFSEDPYYINQYADYKITEFDPKSFIPGVENWVNG